jgi:hypothetical protein
MKMRTLILILTSVWAFALWLGPGLAPAMERVVQFIRGFSA